MVLRLVQGTGASPISYKHNFLVSFQRFGISDSKDVKYRNVTVALYFVGFRIANSKSRKETPQKLTQLRSRSRGKKDSTKRLHHRHHKRQPGEQQYPKQVVTG